MYRNQEFARLERDWGIVTLAQDWLPDDPAEAMAAFDAQPTLVSTPNSGIPAMLTSYVSPEVVRVLQAPNKGAQILGERKEGDWTRTLAYFPVIENTGEVAAYGDRNTNGMSRVNADWPQRQRFLFQTLIDIGDLEADMAGEAKLNWIQENQISAAKTLDKYLDYTYHFGVSNLQNYGILNDPSLSSAIAPATKANGGTVWNTTGGVQNAAANEIFTDIQTLVSILLSRTQGLIETTSRFKLVMPPQSAGALPVTNQFGINVRQLLKQNYENLTIEIDPRYATQSGNVVQLIAMDYSGQDTGYCAFAEKMRDHPVVRLHSSWQQKKTSGTWGAIIRYPLAIAQMIGV